MRIRSYEKVNEERFVISDNPTFPWKRAIQWVDIGYALSNRLLERASTIPGR